MFCLLVSSSFMEPQRRQRDHQGQGSFWGVRRVVEERHFLPTTAALSWLAKVIRKPFTSWSSPSISTVFKIERVGFFPCCIRLLALFYVSIVIQFLHAFSYLIFFWLQIIIFFFVVFFGFLFCLLHFLVRPICPRWVDTNCPKGLNFLIPRYIQLLSVICYLIEVHSFSKHADNLFYFLTPNLGKRRTNPCTNAFQRRNRQRKASRHRQGRLGRKVVFISREFSISFRSVWIRLVQN